MTQYFKMDISRPYVPNLITKNTIIYTGNAWIAAWLFWIIIYFIALCKYFSSICLHNVITQTPLLSAKNGMFLLTVIKKLLLKQLIMFKFYIGIVGILKNEIILLLYEHYIPNELLCSLHFKKKGIAIWLHVWKNLAVWTCN